MLSKWTADRRQAMLASVQLTRRHHNAFRQRATLIIVAVIRRSAAAATEDAVLWPLISDESFIWLDVGA